MKYGIIISKIEFLSSKKIMNIYLVNFSKNVNSDLTTFINSIDGTASKIFVRPLRAMSTKIIPLIEAIKKLTF